MQHLPDHFGPGPVNRVLQQVVQSCIDCAYQPKVLLSALQTDAGGGEIVRGTSCRLVLVRMSPAGLTGFKTLVCLSSENRQRHPGDQTAVSLQCFLRAALPGKHVPSSSV